MLLGCEDYKRAREAKARSLGRKILSQEVAAAEISKLMKDGEGLSKSYLSQFERGEKIPKPYHLAAMQAYYGVSIPPPDEAPPTPAYAPGESPSSQQIVALIEASIALDKVVRFELEADHPAYGAANHLAIAVRPLYAALPQPTRDRITKASADLARKFVGSGQGVLKQVRRSTSS